jgi:hypothetical protein
LSCGEYSSFAVVRSALAQNKLPKNLADAEQDFENFPYRSVGLLRSVVGLTHPTKYFRRHFSGNGSKYSETNLRKGFALFFSKVATYASLDLFITPGNSLTRWQRRDAR